MRISNIIGIFCLMITTQMTASAAIETINLGPAEISLDLREIGSHTVEKGDVISMDHEEPRFQYEIFPANIKINGTDKVMLEVHHMDTSEPLNQTISRKEKSAFIRGILENLKPDDLMQRRDQSTGIEHCIEKSYMVPVGEEMTKKAYAVSGREGILATNNSDSKNPRYILAWSPDQKNGQGSIVCIIGSDLPWEKTKKLFDTISS